MAKKKNITIGGIITEKLYTGIGYIFKMLFGVFSPKKLPAGREVSDLNLLLFSGQKGGKMMKAVLLSVFRTWEKVPHITIATDGTPAAVFEKVMAFWPYPYEIISWKELAARHTAKGGNNLVRFAELNVYGRKLVSLLAVAEDRPTVYCDTDVLWFGEPRLPARSSQGQLTFMMSTDNVHCYHMPIIRYFKRQDMMEKKPLNAGVMFMQGSIYDHYSGFDEMMGFFSIFDEAFPEQTAFAFIADRLGDRWSLDEIILDTTDTRWPIIPRYLFAGDHFARHHVLTKKTWFWRDALYILLFGKSKTRAQRSQAVLKHV